HNLGAGKHECRVCGFSVCAARGSPRYISREGSAQRLRSTVKWLLELSDVGMSHVICICQTTQLPTDPLTNWVIGSVGRWTNTYDMGHWTSQHLTAEKRRLLF